VIVAVNACGGSGTDETVRPGAQDGSTPSDAPSEPVADATTGDFADARWVDGEGNVDTPDQTSDGMPGPDGNDAAEQETEAEAAAPSGDAEAGVQTPDADGATDAADSAARDAADHDAATDAGEDAAGIDSGGDAERDAPEDATGDGAADATSSPDASDSGTAPTCAPVPPCATKIWTLIPDNAAAESATVTTCGIHLYDNGPSDIFQIQQGPLTAPATLTGDFTLTVSFANVASSSSSFSGFQVIVNAGGSGSEFFVSAPSGGYEVASYLAAGSVSPSDVTAASTATSGVATFSRVGTTLTATVTAGGAVASKTGTAGTGPLYVRIALANGVDGASSVEVTSVEVTGSTGTFQSDAFRCGSL
jgi:hypothetical protein